MFGKLQANKAFNQVWSGVGKIWSPLGRGFDAARRGVTGMSLPEQMIAGAIGVTGLMAGGTAWNSMRSGRAKRYGGGNI